MLNWLYALMPTAGLQASIEGCSTELVRLQSSSLYKSKELEALLESVRADLSEIKLLIPAVLEEAKRVKTVNAKELEAELHSLKDLLKGKNVVNEEEGEPKTDLPNWQLSE